MSNKIDFSRKDLLVTLVIMAFLVMTLGAIGTTGHERSMRLVCSSNINQNLTALNRYAVEHGGEFPLNDGFWLWDFSYTTASAIADSVSDPNVFFCPSNRTQRQFRKQYWNWSGCHITGYFWMMRSGGAISGSGNKKWARSMFVSNPAQTELVTDATLSNQSNYTPPDFPYGNFARITQGGMWGAHQVYDTSNHIKSEREAWGGNMGFVDGHVSWRPFSQMEPGLLNPSHWW